MELIIFFLVKSCLEPVISGIGIKDVKFLINIKLKALFYCLIKFKSKNFKK